MVISNVKDSKRTFNSIVFMSTSQKDASFGVEFSCSNLTSRG